MLNLYLNAGQTPPSQSWTI